MEGVTEDGEVCLESDKAFCCGKGIKNSGTIRTGFSQAGDVFYRRTFVYIIFPTFLLIIWYIWMIINDCLNSFFEKNESEEGKSEKNESEEGKSEKNESESKEGKSEKNEQLLLLPPPQSHNFSDSMGITYYYCFHRWQTLYPDIIYHRNTFEEGKSEKNESESEEGKSEKNESESEEGKSEKNESEEGKSEKNESDCLWRCAKRRCF